MALNRGASSRNNRWPAPGKGSKRAPGIRRASSTPFAYGTTRSTLPCATRVGAVISSTAVTAATKRVQASYCARQQSGGVGCSSRSASSCSNSSGCSSVQPGTEGERHRRARELRRRAGRAFASQAAAGLGGKRHVLGPARAGADEDEPLDELRMAQRERLCDVAAHREAGDVRAAALERFGRVVRQLLDRVGPGWLRRAARAPVLDRDTSEPLRPVRDLTLPRPDCVAEPRQQQQWRAVAVFLGVELHVTADRSSSRTERRPASASVRSSSAASCRTTASTPAAPPTASP